MTSLGFENYAEALKIYLSKYREVSLLVKLPLPVGLPLVPRILLSASWRFSADNDTET